MARSTVPSGPRLAHEYVLLAREWAVLHADLTNPRTPQPRGGVRPANQVARRMAKIEASFAGSIEARNTLEALLAQETPEVQIVIAAASARMGSELGVLTLRELATQDSVLGTRAAASLVALAGGQPRQRRDPTRFS